MMNRRVDGDPNLYLIHLHKWATRSVWRGTKNAFASRCHR